MNVVHLTASTFLGGPERQMLGLALALPPAVRTTFASFREHGRSAALVNAARGHGFPAVALAHDTPRLFAAAREVADLLRGTAADVLLCHGYKANLLGRPAARRAGIPAVAVSRGWTGENWKVRRYEQLDRWHLRRMDHVVCVSDGQAEKVRRCGVPSDRLSVIRNSARLDAFAGTDPDARGRLLDVFPAHARPARVVLAAGRLSPEKGFDVLVEAAAAVCGTDPAAGVALFGEGAERPKLEARVAALGLTGRVVMPGFRDDLDAFIPAADVVVLPSYTEGLPNVALEASAAGVPVVATAVGGTPEVVADGETGFLVLPGQPEMLAARVLDLLRSPDLRLSLGDAGRKRMREQFTFEAQAAAYLRLFDRLRPTTAVVSGRVGGRSRITPLPPPVGARQTMAGP